MKRKAVQRKVLGADMPTANQWLGVPRSQDVIRYISEDAQWVDRWGNPSPVGLDFQTRTVTASRAEARTFISGQFPVVETTEVVEMHMCWTLRHLAATLDGANLVLAPERPLMASFEDSCLCVNVKAWPAVPGLTVPNDEGEYGATPT